MAVILISSYLYIYNKTTTTPQPQPAKPANWPRLQNFTHTSPPSWRSLAKIGSSKSPEEGPWSRDPIGPTEPPGVKDSIHSGLIHSTFFRPGLEALILLGPAGVVLGRMLRVSWKMNYKSFGNKKQESGEESSSEGLEETERIVWLKKNEEYL